MSLLKSIKPNSEKRSDKYSLCLWRFMKENYIDGHRCDRVYATQWSLIDGSFVAFKSDDPEPSQIFIGRLSEDGFMTGRKLSDIISGINGYKQCYAMIPNSYPDAIDITNWFWSEYMRIGRALWDVHGVMHMQGDEDRFTYVGNTRRCNWSGRWYKKKIEKKSTTKRIERWYAEA